MRVWQTEKHFSHIVLVEGAQTDALRADIAAFLDANGETASRLAKVSHGHTANGTEMHEFITGRRRITPVRADRVVAAMAGYPKGFEYGEAKPGMAYSRSAEYRLTKELNANRDAARALRAAWIEQQRQAEIERYGFTTIDRDVTEMVA